MDLVGNRFDEVHQEVSRDPPCGLLVQYGEGYLRGPVDGDKKIELALRGAYISDVDMEVADRVGLELALSGSLDYVGSLDEPPLSLWQLWRTSPIAHPSIPWKTMHHQTPGSNI